jgi:hypothetical protein
MKDLVTVTCNKERHMMLLQAESIQKFLEPCVHWIIINEQNENINTWKEALSPYYTKHELRLISQETLFENNKNIKFNGKVTQQVCKLAIAKLIKADYLILDTKNFFIKPTSINEWDQYIGSTLIEFIDEPPQDYDNYQTHRNGNDATWKSSITQYKKLLNIDKKLFYFLVPITPFKIQYEPLLSSGLLGDIYNNVLFDVDGNPIHGASEFILYSFLVYDNIIPGKNTIIGKNPGLSLCIFNFDYCKNELALESLFNKSNLPSIKIFGFHYTFLKKCDSNLINLINKYLEQKGFNFQFT